MSERRSEREVRELIATWSQAVRDGNLQGVLARHTDDVVMFDVSEPLQRQGLAACRDAWQPFLRDGPHQTFELGELRLHLGDDIAFAHALLRIEPEADFAVRLTLGLRRLEDGWRIVHEHHSAPFPLP